MERRKFPGPCHVERTVGNHFVIKIAKLPENKSSEEASP